MTALADTMTVEKHDIVFSDADLRRLIIPLIIEEILAITVGLADSVMVAGLGNAAVSGVSLVDSVVNLFIQMFTSFAAGGAVIAGRFLGRRDIASARHAAQQLAVLLFGISCIVTAILYAGKNIIISTAFGSIEADVAAATNSYYSVVTCSLPFIALFNIGASLLRMMGHTKISFKVSFLMNCLNVVGNALLIYVAKMGVAGAALSTVICRMVGAAIVITMLRNDRYELALTGMRGYSYNAGVVKSILSVALPNSIENGMFHFGRLILTSLISTFGTAAITANAIGGPVGVFQVCSAAAVGTGLTTVASQCVGAGLYDRTREYTRKLMKFAYLVEIAINLAIFLLLPAICRLYKVSGVTEQLARQVIIIHGVAGIVVYPFAFVLPCTLRSAGDARFTMLVSSCTMWIFRVGFSFVLGIGCGLGVVGVYLAQAVDWTLRGFVFFLRIKGHTWEKKTQMNG